MVRLSLRVARSFTFTMESEWAFYSLIRPKSNLKSSNPGSLKLPEQKLKRSLASEMRTEPHSGNPVSQDLGKCFERNNKHVAYNRGKCPSPIYLPQLFLFASKNGARV